MDRVQRKNVMHPDQLLFDRFEGATSRFSRDRVLIPALWGCDFALFTSSRPHSGTLKVRLRAFLEFAPSFWHFEGATSLFHEIATSF